MVLQCQCGGALELTRQNYSDDRAFEAYCCASCGRTGTYSFGVGGETMTGCVTAEAVR